MRKGIRVVTVDIRLPRPHAGQLEILKHRGSAVVFAGRRYGKTQMAVYKILREATRLVGLYWWVGLSWRSASLKRAWRLLKYYARKMWAGIGEHDKRKFVHESRAEITLPNGSAIWLRTAQQPDSLAGEGVRGVVFDEFSLMDEVVWTEYVEATLVDYAGWALFIGVPKGNNWAANLWRAAHTREGWIARRFTSYDNPHNNHGHRLERLNQIRAHSTEQMFSQEYLAEITDDAGTVFRGVHEAATASMPGEYMPGEVYVMGLDWGRKDDYTAMVVIEVRSKRMVAMDQYNKISWALQRDRVKAMVERWKPALIYGEENSIGEPNIEVLQREGLPQLLPFNTNGESKSPLIEALSTALERGELSIQREPLLMNELQAYEMERLPSGRFRYNAPSGLHDDLVIALALAWHGVLNVPLTRSPSWLNERV